MGACASIRDARSPRPSPVVSLDSSLKGPRASIFGAAQLLFKDGQLPSLGKKVSTEDQQLSILATFLSQLCLDYHSRHPQKLTKPVAYTFPGALLFVDISGFTKLNAALAHQTGGAEQVSKSINSYFASIISIVQSYGGDVLKFAGDALICLFSPTNTEYNVEDWDTAAVLNSEKAIVYRTVSKRAIRCGLHVQHTCQEQEMFGTILRLHCGVTSGDIVSLHLGGNEGQWEHIVSGEVVRAMSAVLDAANSGELCTTAETFQAVSDCFKGEDFGDGIYCVRDVQSQKGPTGEQLSLAEIFQREQDKVSTATIQLTTNMIPVVQSYVPPLVHRMLEGLQATDGESVGSSFRQVSVFFATLTKLKIDSVHLRNQLEPLNDALNIMQAYVHKFNGVVRQFLEDDKGIVLIAVWGVATHYHDDDPYRATSAALAIHNALNLKFIPVAIGVTSGTVFAGNVGFPGRREFAVVGHVVNLAARLMGKAKDSGDLLCDDLTNQFCQRHGIQCEPLPPVQLKGMADPIPVFRPLRDSRLQTRMTASKIKTTRSASPTSKGGSPLARHSNPIERESPSSSLHSQTSTGSDASNRSMQTRSTSHLNPTTNPPSLRDLSSMGTHGSRGEQEEKVALIGRDHDQARLAAAVDALASNEKQSSTIVFIEGDPGIGKSILLRDALLYAEEHWGDHVYLLANQANSVDIEESYFIFKPLFLSLLAVPEDTEDEVDCASLDLREPLLSCLRNNKLFDEWMPMMSMWNGILPGLKFDVNPAIASMSSEARRMALHAMMIHMLSLPSMAVLLAVDDAQFLDPSSWALIHDIARQSTDATGDAVDTDETRELLLILCLRPFKSPPVVAEIVELPTTLRLVLNPLPSSTVAAIASQMIGVTQLPAAVERIINSKAMGNPFFGGELVKMLVDKKLLEIKDGSCFLCPGAEESLGQLKLPTSIQGTILPRIDELHHEQELILRVACCLGLEFQSSYIMQVWPVCSDQATFDAHLIHLVRVGMIRHKSRAGVMNRRMSQTDRFASNYQFKHPVIMDTVYSCMPHQTRQDLHRRCAQFYDSIFQYEPPWARLAHHYFHAVGGGDPVAAKEVAKMDFALYTRALEVTVTAGDLAFRQVNYGQAVEMYEKAMDLLGLLPQGGTDIAAGTRELELLLNMLVPMMQIKGFGAKETTAIFSRASGLSDSLCQRLRKGSSRVPSPEISSNKLEVPSNRRKSTSDMQRQNLFSAVRRLEGICALLVSHQKSPVEAGRLASTMLLNAARDRPPLAFNLHLTSLQAQGELYEGEFSKSRNRVVSVLNSLDGAEALLQLPTWTPFHAAASCFSVAALASLHLGDRAMHDYYFQKGVGLARGSDNQYHLSMLFATHAMHLALYGDLNAASLLATDADTLATSEKFEAPKCIASFTLAYTKFMPAWFDLQEVLADGPHPDLADEETLRAEVEAAITTMTTARLNSTTGGPTSAGGSNPSSPASPRPTPAAASPCPVFFFPLLCEACFKMHMLRDVDTYLAEWREAAEARGERALFSEYHVCAGERELRNVRSGGSGSEQLSDADFMRVTHYFDRGLDVAVQQQTPIAQLKAGLHHCCCAVDFGRQPSEDMLQRLRTKTDSVVMNFYDSHPPQEDAAAAAPAAVAFSSCPAPSDILVVGFIRAFFERLQPSSADEEGLEPDDDG